MKPENTDTPLKADCLSAPCSPSSTPETNAILGGANAWNAFEEDIIAFARKLERERNAMRDAVRSYRDAKGRYHTQLACERLLSLLPDNATCPSTGATEKAKS